MPGTSSEIPTNSYSEMKQKKPTNISIGKLKAERESEKKSKDTKKVGKLLELEEFSPMRKRSSSTHKHLKNS